MRRRTWAQIAQLQTDRDLIADRLSEIAGRLDAIEAASIRNDHTQEHAQ